MAMPLTPAQVAEALIAEFAAAVDAAVGDAVAGPSSTPAAGDGWRVTGAISGARRGTVQAWFDLGGAEMLARRLTGAEAPEHAAVTAVLRDLWAQTSQTLTSRPEFAGVTLAFGPPESTGAPNAGAVYELRSGDVVARIAL
ncbi:MAG: hypothetical protein OEW19_04695, partial [Acidobacteriota bacterium]|nr:hypothetical protein [Acidobacteriota bacterium]